MGKSKKHKKDRDKELTPQEELKRLLKKISEVTSKVDDLQKKVDNGGPSAEESQQADKENIINNSQPNTSMEKEEIVDGKDDETQVLENEDESGSKSEVDEEWLNLIGDDPSMPRSMTTEVRSELCNIWKFYCREGMKKEDEVTLIEKYACAPDFATPKLNPQIAATMKEPAKARDNHMSKIQNIAGLVLTLTGSLITKIYNNRNEGLDLEEILEPLKEIGKLTSLLIHKQSQNRKAFIEPGLNKETVNILKESKIDELLYRKELSVKIKESKALVKEGEGLLKVQQQPSTPKPYRSSNFIATYKGRPRGMGSTGFRGQARPRFAFRGRQQFVNQRAQTPRGKANPTQRQPVNPPPKDN